MSDPIITSAGWAVFGDNLFRGHAVAAELFARTTHWSALSLALGNRSLTREESAFLDDLAVAMSAADPRIWPLKVAWLVGCHGSAHAALAATHAFIATAGVGPGVAGEAAELWRDLARQSSRSRVVTPSASDRHEAILAHLSALKARGHRLPGFGVPGRNEDERLVLIRRAVVAHRRDHLPFFRLLEETDEVSGGLGVRVNVVAAAAACYLDLGFQPAEIGPLMLVSMLHTLWANAAESARLQPPSLQCVDLADVEYLGPAPRPLPRTSD